MFSFICLRNLLKMLVRWSILALVGVGIARTCPEERFGTVVDGIDFLEFSERCKVRSKKHISFRNDCSQKHDLILKSI